MYTALNILTGTNSVHASLNIQDSINQLSWQGFYPLNDNDDTINALEYDNNKTLFTLNKLGNL